MTYELHYHAVATVGSDGAIAAADAKPTAIKCLECGRTSHHPKDIAELYCGNCHKFHEKGEIAW